MERALKLGVSVGLLPAQFINVAMGESPVQGIESRLPESVAPVLDDRHLRASAFSARGLHE